MKTSYGQNLAIRLIESLPGHVSSELSLPEGNSDQAHKKLSSRNPEAPDYHFLSWIVPFNSHLQFAPKEIFKKFHMGCQEQIKVPKSCLQYGYFLQDAHILYYLWFDVITCFEWSYIDQLGANSLLVSSLVKCPTTNQYGMGFQQDGLSGIVREKQFYLIWV